MTPENIRNHIAASCGYTEPSKAEMSAGEALDLILNKAEIVEDNQARLTRAIPAEALDQMQREDWATVAEQSEYWRIRDKDLDRIESNCQNFDEKAEHERDLRHESRVDYESWQTDNE